MEIKKYDESLAKEWDEFVSNSINGTIYHSRKFLNYHKDKFQDESILIYDNELVCVVPCCKKDNNYFSHSGATYGGPVFKNFELLKIKKIIDLIFEYYKNKIEFRIAGNIYFNVPQNKLFFLLNQKLKIKLELSWYVNNFDNWFDNIKNKRNKSYLDKFEKNHNITIANNNDDYINFHNILSKNLNEKYKSNPTHSLDEFLIFKNQIEENQSLYLVKKENIILGGVLLVKATNNCWYTFYISKNSDYNSTSNCSILFIMKNISLDARKNNVKYLDYGISTEDKGLILNEGLSIFKEETLCGNSDFRYNFMI